MKKIILNICFIFAILIMFYCWIAESVFDVYPKIGDRTIDWYLRMEEKWS